MEQVREPIMMRCHIILLLNVHEQYAERDAKERVTDPKRWISLAPLTVLEIILGIDNIVAISLLARKLPHTLRPGRGRSA
jgi:hypothetical protein